MTTSLMPLPPPSRPKKKRHSGEWNGNEDANGDHGGLADFVVEEKDVVRDKNTGMTTRRKIPFAPSTSYPRQQKESSLHSLGTDKEDKQQSASPSMTASSINQSSQSNTSVTNNSLRVNNPSALPPLSSSSQSNAFRVSSLAASSTSGTPPSSAKRMTRKREDPRWNQVVHLTPAEQSRLYWVLCYGTDNNNGHNASNPLPPTSSVRRKPPARGVLKRPKKRHREQTQDDAFESPQASTTSMEDAFRTPVGDTNAVLVSQKSRTGSRVKFGPSQAVCFDSGTPVVGGLEPLPSADVQFPSDMPEEAEEETSLVEETKANAACLAAWDDVVLSDDDDGDDDDGDDDDNDGSFIIAQPVRLGRRSSTYFSPSAKSLLDEPDPSSLRADSSSDDDFEDDDDPMTASLDPSVDNLLLSSLQVNSPTMEEASRLSSPTVGISKVSPSETSNDCAMMEGSEIVASPSRPGASPTKSNCTGKCYNDQDESSLLLQLLQPANSPNEWIRCFQASPPLQKLLSAAMDAYMTEAVETSDTMELPFPYQTLTSDVHVMQGVLKHMERLHRQAASTHENLLAEGISKLEQLRPPTMATRISNEEAEITLLQRSITREEKALTTARQRRMERELARDQRQLVEWKALSSILADIDFPREDDTSPTGLAYGFPVTKLGCEVILRPAADGTLDSATLDIAEEFGMRDEDLPPVLREMFRDLLSVKLSGLLEYDANDFDFQHAARRIIVLLGRLDRILEDLMLACQQWDHDFTTDETTTALRVHIAPNVSIIMKWHTNSAYVLEYSYPNQVQLMQGENIETLKAVHPPSLRSLWKKVVAGKISQA